MKRHLLTTLLAFLPLQTIFSQQEDYVSFDFFTLTWSEQLEEGIFFQPSANAAPEAVEGVSRYIKGPYKYFGPPRLTFFKESVNKEGVPVRTPVAFTDLNRTYGRGILVFTSPQNGRYRIFPVFIDTNNFAAGSYRFFNLTDRNVFVRLGDERASIRPRGETVIQPRVENRQSFSAQMASPDKNGELELIFSTEWTHQSNKRVMVFFYDDGSGSVQVKIQPV